MTLVRVATADDLAAVQDVFWQCWTRSYAVFAPPEALAGLSRGDADVLWAESLGRDDVLVAQDDDGRVVGIVRFTVSDDRIAVHSLHVAPESQGSGVGGRLLDAAESAAGPVAGSDLWVFSDNAPARRFYASRGWLPDGATRVDDRVRMPETHLTRTAHGGAARVLVGRGVCVHAAENPPAGAVVGVWSPERSDVWAAGVRDTTGTPMTTHTVHDLASVTKLVTTCAVMALVSAGRLDLDAPVSDHLGWSGPDPTLRDLLRHRTGLLPWQPLHNAARSREEVLALLPRLPRGGGVDESFAYSDLSFIALGAVVEEVTGHRLDDAVRGLVTQPLGLGLHYRPEGTAGDDSAGSAEAEPGGAAPGDSDDVAASALDEGWEERMIAAGQPYPVHLEHHPALPRVVRRAPVRGTVHDANAFHAMGGVSGHAGLFGSVPDLLGLGRALVDTSHGQWSEAVVEEFTTAGPDPGQGLGFRLRPLRADDGPPRAGREHAGSSATESAGRTDRLAWHPGFTGMALGVRLGGSPTVLAMATNRHLHDGMPVPTDRLWARVLQAELPLAPETR